MGQVVSAIAGTKRPAPDPDPPSPGLSCGAKVSPVQVRTKRPRINETRNCALHAELVRQLQFYFSPANLRKDRFLVDQMWSNAGGWVKIETLLSFNRVQKMGANAKDVLVACRAVEGLDIREGCDRSQVEDSRDQGVLEASVRIKGGLEEVEKILSARNLPEEDSRTVYAETFKGDVTHEEVTEIFVEYGQVDYVSIPRFHDGTAKGFAFIEFAEAKAAQNCVRCLSMEKGSLRVMLKKDWKTKKEEYKRLQKERRKLARLKPLPTSKTSSASLNSPQDLSDPQPTKSHPPARPAYQVGVVLALKGLSKGNGVTRKSLFEALEEYGPVAYVEYKPQTPDECRVRFMHPANAQGALKALLAKDAKLLDASVEARLLAGEEESHYWKLIAARMKEKHQRTQAKQAKKPKLQKTKRGKQIPRVSKGPNGKHSNQQKVGAQESKDRLYSETQDIKPKHTIFEE